jgi:SAM-dependent methyltransferase
MSADDLSIEETYELDLLQGSLSKWRSSLGLRKVYGAIYERMRQFAEEGSWLEVGSGIGVASEFLPRVVKSDIAETGHVDRVVDAYAIPQENWDAIFGLDVFHHLRQPRRFLDSAAEALKPGGRLILAEPAATPLGCIFYGLCHHEPMRKELVQPPYEFPLEADGSFANMAMATVLLAGEVDEVEAVIGPRWRRVECVHSDLLAYPFSGGFSRPQMLPTFLIAGLIAVEKKLPQWLMKRLGLRVTIVLERV